MMAVGEVAKDYNNTNHTRIGVISLKSALGFFSICQNRILSVGSKMIDLDPEHIINFITYSLGLTEEETEEKAEYYMRLMISRVFRNNQFFTKYDDERLKEQIIKLRKIRVVYQKGKIFVHNQTKGKQKGYLQRWYDIYKDLNDPEMAKRHLKHIKGFKSERTYYRHKAKLKELGLI